MYDFNEIQRGLSGKKSVDKLNNLYDILSGVGTYTLLKQFEDFARPSDEMSLIMCYSPEEIVRRLQNKDDTDVCKKGKMP